MTNREACGPCARRKVRCDKQEPSCGNCKRRKGDRCVYPPISSTEKIRRLETLVRKLGGDPNNNSAGAASNKETSSEIPSTQSQAAGVGSLPLEVRSQDPIVLEEDGDTFYVESSVWQEWLGKGASKNYFTPRKGPHAFSDLMFSSQYNTDLASRHPSPAQASTMWSIFWQRVEPVVRITYRWRLRELQAKALNPEAVKCLSGPEHAFVFSLYLISIVSLLPDECDNLLYESRSFLMLQYHAICEETLLRTNIFSITDIRVIQALIFYMMASFERLVSMQSIWSLMGLTIRNAEKLGLHRDGLALGLSPEQTEERRRVWWQLQHIDLCVGICSGSTPMTLMADWDAKIPLNIEDDDISPSTVAMPQERQGLSSMAYCRYTSWIIDQQRQGFRAKQGRFALSWQANPGLASKVKDDVLKDLETGLNTNFLQYCDPIKPLDTLVQLTGRFTITVMRLHVLHGSVFYGREKKQISDEVRTALLDAATQCVKYNIALNSQLKHFQWYTRLMFSWQAFMLVLVEASRESDMAKAQEIWDLLADVYATNPILFVLSEDRRRHHAAELVVAAWKAWQHRLGPSAQYMSSPPFVSQLKAGLAAFRSGVDQETAGAPDQLQSKTSEMAPITPESIMTENVVDFTFDMDFQDIDWSFWNSME